MSEIKRVTKREAVTVDSVEASKYQKAGTLTCMLRQTIKPKTTYPSATISDGISDSLFSMNEFDIEDGQTYTNSEKRVAFINVPTGTTVQMVELKLKQLVDSGKERCIMNVISSEPILSDNQKAAMTKGFKTLDEFADSQVVRYGDTHKNAGQLILDDNGNVMYKRTHFKADLVEDENICSDECYTSVKIAKELAGIAETVDAEASDLFGG